MGANHQGEIAHLASIAEPTIGIVTNAGAAHLEGFGSLDGVAHGQGRDVPRAAAPKASRSSTPTTRSRRMWRDAQRRRARADVRLRAARRFHGAQGAARSGDASRIPHRFRSRHAVRHAARDACARRACTTCAMRSARPPRRARRVPTLDEIVAGLAAMKTVAGRLELKPAINGAFLVDDSYNANPSSLKAGLDAFRSFGGARWLVLGEMRELGDSADELHAEVGRYARQAGIERLFAVGERSRFAVEAFGRGAQWFADIDALITEARKSLDRRRRGADQGIARESARARRRGAGASASCAKCSQRTTEQTSRRSRQSRRSAALPRTRSSATAANPAFRRLQLPDAARDSRRADGAGDLVHRSGRG